MPYVNKIAPQKLSNYIFFKFIHKNLLLKKMLIPSSQKNVPTPKKSYFKAELNKKTIFEMIQKID